MYRQDDTTIAPRYQDWRWGMFVVGAMVINFWLSVAPPRNELVAVHGRIDSVKWAKVGHGKGSFETNIVGVQGPAGRQTLYLHDQDAVRGLQAASRDLGPLQALIGQRVTLYRPHPERWLPDYQSRRILDIDIAGASVFDNDAATRPDRLRRWWLYGVMLAALAAYLMWRRILAMAANEPFRAH